MNLAEEDDWHFRTRCTSCNEDAENPIYFNHCQFMDIEGSRGQANYIAKCKLCGHKGYIEYCQNSRGFYTDSENWQTLATFECRNIEIAEFIPTTLFKAQGTGGDGETIFDDIDLGGEDHDWAGYDEGGDCAVGVYEFKSQIIRA